jgi:16S rRNA (cytidine1402-2'-O)-methyltransferase
MPLVIVPTPVGNLEDMTLRGLRELKEASVILCEDTRRTIKLLNYYGIKKTLIACHQHNERARAEELMTRLESGERVALVSDAGTPGISDPGFIIIKESIERGFPVDALPGANAILPALLMSGISPRTFTFAGFLEGEGSRRGAKISELAGLSSALVFYIAPHDLDKDLEFILRHLGDREAALVREISKAYQETIRGTLSELKKISRERRVRGEIVLVVSGSDKSGDDSADWRSEAMSMKEEGIFDKEIANKLFESYGIPRNTVKAFLLGQDGLVEFQTGGKE